ncbi:MAG: hypothetical protein AB1611_13690 [bacterium]
MHRITIAFNINSRGKGTWRIAIVPLLVILIGIAGCTAFSPKQAAVAVRKEKLRRIKRIAVLPFNNLSDRLDAEVMVTNLLISEISRDGKLSAVKYGDVHEFLLQQKIQSTETVTREILKGLVEKFSVDGVMLGTITAYREWNPDRSGDPPMVEISARLVDCETGKTLWFSRGKRTGQDERLIFDIGETRFCSQLAQKVVKDFVKAFRAGS